MRLDLGKPVTCSDGRYGELADIVVDPTKKRVTHLVINPDDDEPTRLVPVDLVARANDGDAEITLSCTKEEAHELPTVQEYAYLTLGESIVDDPNWDIGVENVLALPYYGGTAYGAYEDMYGGATEIVYDRVPKGEVEVRRESAVYDSDGHHLGHVEGFIVDSDEQITHFVLERGHLWGKRDVTIPIGSVDKVETDSVTLRLSKKEVGELPAVRVNRWH